MARYDIDIRINASGAASGGRTATRALNDVDAAAQRTQRDMAALAGETQFAANGLGRLSAVATGLASALAVDQVIRYADAWASTTNRLVNAAKAGETLADVTDRVFRTAQESAGGLAETAQLYGRLEAASRGLLKTGDEVAGVVETVNKAFVVSGATAAESAGALVQLSQALGAGALRGEEFNSVNEAAPRLMQALADSLGVTRGALKDMASEGQLTAQVLIKAFQEQGAKIDAEFDKMQRTFEQKGVMAANNLAKAFGKNGALNSGVAALGDAMVAASENADILITAGVALSTVYGARLVGSLQQATAAKLQSAAASRAALAAETNAALGAQRRATAAAAAAKAELAAARAAIAASNGQITATANAFRLAAAQEAVAATATQAAAAGARLTAAQTAQAAASSAAGIAARAASGALALIGGPAGAAVLAAGGIFMLYQKMQQGKEEARSYADQIDGVSAALKDMSKIQLGGELDKIRDFMRQAAEDSEDLQDELNGLIAANRSYTQQQEALQAAGRSTAEVEKLIARNLDDQADVRLKIRNLGDQYIKAQGLAAQATRELGKEAEISSIGLQAVSDAMRGVKAAAEPMNESAQQVIESLRAQIDSLQMGSNAYARHQALQKAKTDADTAEGAMIIELVDKHQALIDAKEAAAEASRKQAEATRERNALMQETQRLIEDEIEQERRAAEARKAAQASAASAARPGATSGYGGIVESMRADLDEQKRLRDQQLADEQLSNAQRLEVEQQYQAAKYGIEQEAQRKLAELQKQHVEQQVAGEEARKQALLNSASFASDALGNITQAMRDAGKDQGIAYKVAFAAQKAAAIPSIITATETGAAQALALGPVAGPILSGVIKGLGYASLGVVAGQAVAGFETGGYTGNMGKQQIAGVVHGREFVAHAEATRKNRSALEYMNRTGNLPGGGVNLTVIDNSTGSKTYTTEQLTENDVRLIIEDRVPAIMAREQADPNSRFAKTQRTVTTAGRRL